MDLAEQLARDGYALARGVVGRRRVDELIAAVSAAGGYAIRNLLDVVPETAALARSPQVLALVNGVLGAKAFPVGGILFDKTPAANWLVPWHQDVTIRVQQRVQVPGFGPWTVKAGVIHVQPPADILDAMIVVRIHLDPSGEGNGALKVLPGTHAHGRLNADDLDDARRKIRAVACAADAGDVLLMKPLLVHASSAADRPEHRRVIHIEYASCELPGGLRWLGVS